MSKKESSSTKKLNKRIARALTLTIAAAAVVPLLPSNLTTAEVSRDVKAADEIEVQSVDAADPINQEPEEKQPEVQVPIVEAPTEEKEEPAKSEVVVQPEVAALNPAQTAKSVAELQTALTAVELALNLTGYQSLSPEDQAEVAAVLLNSNSGEAFGDSGAIQQALNKAVAAQRDIAALRDAITAVNSAQSAEQLKRALEVPYLGLVLLNYRNLSEEGKLATAAAVLQAVPAGGFVSRTDIQKSFNTAIAAVLEAGTQE
ncbi:hypothetical protein ACFOQM_01875 [Paenibacillus sp. GCM10012307]|uniref:Uncharacterized protein n=1 Tax=Paenibacillus roseus TaxID=2798579 RepID=A0A934J4A4_9BACL|nr:hypothetical protein [Paenibacillus roseus]MBJ6360067.1 hypothetical protein [Paenibacillus roseus]